MITEEQIKQLALEIDNEIASEISKQDIGEVTGHKKVDILFFMLEAQQDIAKSLRILSGRETI